MNVLSDAFNKATPSNAFCIRLDQSCDKATEIVLSRQEI
jgi:hypothetical protein